MKVSLWNILTFANFEFLEIEFLPWHFNFNNTNILNFVPSLQSGILYWPSSKNSDGMEINFCVSSVI